MMIGEALVKEVSEDFWRLEIGSGDDRLVWYGLSKKDVEKPDLRTINEKIVDFKESLQCVK
jgi:hypothetical protein